MDIKAYTCPSCGAPLEVKYDTAFTRCSHSGTRVHISYEGEGRRKILTLGSLRTQIQELLWPTRWFRRIMNEKGT